MKKQLRQKFRALRNDFKYRTEKSQCVTEKFLNTHEYKACEKLFIFLSYGSEIETRNIIQKAFEDKKTVALPYMTGKPHEMVFIKISSVSELVKNKYGIEEPVYNEENILVSDEKTVIAVPALAFDKTGYRLGYGGGYYDKYLGENKYMKSIGIAFDFQITDNIPKDKYDVKTDMVITERGIINENLN